MEESQRKDKRKSAKKIIKLAKKNPGWYTKEEVKYAKYIKKLLKKKNATSETDNSHTQSRGDDGGRGKGEQPKQPRQPKRLWIAKVLHKARSLVVILTSTYEG